MKFGKFKLTSLMLILGTSLLGAQDVNFKEILLSAEGLPIINSTDEKDILPGNFRMSKILPLYQDQSLNLSGLDTMNLSGSSQFSEHSLKAIINAIKKQAGDNIHITIVNLRQENGGFLDPQEGSGAIAFSYLMPMPWWTGENPAGNRTVEEIERSEEQAMAKITDKHVITIYGASDSYAPSDQHNILYKIDMAVKRAMTEKTLVTEKGLGYFRIPDKKFGNMEYEHVDEFVNFVKNLPANEWVHFHCKRGKSRTTLFMIMYDMMRNADKTTAMEIIERQGPKGVGGSDMIDFPDTNDWDFTFKKGWSDFLVQFHAYAKANKGSSFQKSWTQWAQENNVSSPPAITLGEYYRNPNVNSQLPVDTDAPYKGKVLVLNSLNETKMSLSNFRSSRDAWLDKNLKFNKVGLETLNASGSNQYSEAGLALIIPKLKKMAPRVVVVDLRHDDHLFVNGLNVSTFESKDALLKPRTPAEVIASEKALKEDLLKYKRLEIHAIETKYPKNAFDDRFVLTVKPNKISTPQEFVTSLGAEYVLIGNKRFSAMADDDVVHFVNVIRSMPRDTWFHLHCKKGKSRTTMFLAVLDMMRNADKVSMEEILNRQYQIGGINLFNVTAKDATWAEERDAKKQWVVFLARFHLYAKENMATNFEMSWKEWSEAHADYQPDVDHLLIDNT